MPAYLPYSNGRPSSRADRQRVLLDYLESAALLNGEKGAASDVGEKLGNLMQP
jgi:hypothetical protein